MIYTKHLVVVESSSTVKSPTMTQGGHWEGRPSGSLQSALGQRRGWMRDERRGFLSSCVRTVGRSLACREGKGSWRAKMTWSTLLVYRADTGTKRVEGMRKTVARPGLGEECEP